MNEIIFDKIKNKILFLELEPGETIDEKKLAAEFKVSRTPIREVLQRLEWEGFVDIVPRGAMSVSTLEYNRVKNTYFMRVHIEGLAGKLAAAYGKSVHTARMQDVLDRIAAEKEALSSRKLIHYDRIFRSALYDATGNSVLKDTSDRLYEQTMRIWLSHIQNDPTSAILKSEFEFLVEEIKTMIETTGQRDMDKAEKDRKDIIIRHIRRANEYFMQDIQLY